MVHKFIYVLYETDHIQKTNLFVVKKYIKEKVKVYAIVFSEEDKDKVLFSCEEE